MRATPSAVVLGAGADIGAQATRFGLVIARSPDDAEHERILASSKSNLGPPLPALRYRIAPRTPGSAVPAIEWLGPCDYTAATARAVRQQEQAARRRGGSGPHLGGGRGGGVAARAAGGRSASGGGAAGRVTRGVLQQRWWLPTEMSMHVPPPSPTPPGRMRLQRHCAHHACSHHLFSPMCRLLPLTLSPTR